MTTRNEAAERLRSEIEDLRSAGLTYEEVGLDLDAALAAEREPLLVALANLVDTANDKGWEGEQWDEARALIEQYGRTK